jgi:phosphopantetheinyl transferase
VKGFDTPHLLPVLKHPGHTGLYIDNLIFKNREEVFAGSICFCRFLSPEEHKTALSRLQTGEREYYDTIKSEKRRKDYLLGRYSAKLAVAKLTGEQEPDIVTVEKGDSGQPVLRYRSFADIQVSITHTGDFGAAAVFPKTCPLGIDLEKVSPGRAKVLAKKMTDGEKKLLENTNIPRDRGLIMVWTAKEALSKLLKTGFTIPFDMFEISEMTSGNHGQAAVYFRNFPGYKSLFLDLGSYGFSIAFSGALEPGINSAALKEFFLREEK